MRFSNEQPHADREGFERYCQDLFREKCRGFGTGVVVGEVCLSVSVSVSVCVWAGGAAAACGCAWTPMP